MEKVLMVDVVLDTHSRITGCVLESDLYEFFAGSTEDIKVMGIQDNGHREFHRSQILRITKRFQ